MQFTFQEDSNLYGYQDGEEKFEFPTNIKQMGSIDEGIRIYMEDYVYTYLFQYAKASGNKEKLAALVGKQMIVDNELVVIISGAIQGKGSVKQAGMECFSEETWEYINNQMEVYFKGLSVVGWMHTHPGYGAFLMSRDESYHRERFPEKHQVLYVLDPMEKQDGFFVHNQEGTGLRAAKGYFIYYAKNDSMQEYMLENSLIKPKLSREEQEAYDEANGVAPPKEERRVKNERIDAAQKIRRVLNEKEAEERQAQTRYTLLAGISGILCIACLMMGVGLLYNQDRIKRLENEVITVKTSYRAMEERIDDKVIQAVFAGQNAAAETKAPEQEEKAQPAVKHEQEIPVSAEPPTQEQAPEAAEPKAAEVQAETPPAEAEAETQPAEPESSIPEFYIVEEGDNLGYISQKFYGTKDKMAEIMEVNNLEDADMIFYGKKLLLPR